MRRSSSFWISLYDWLPSHTNRSHLMTCIMIWILYFFLLYSSSYLVAKPSSNCLSPSNHSVANRDWLQLFPPRVWLTRVLALVVRHLWKSIHCEKYEYMSERKRLIADRPKWNGSFIKYEQMEVYFSCERRRFVRSLVNELGVSIITFHEWLNLRSGFLSETTY